MARKYSEIKNILAKTLGLWIRNLTNLSLLWEPNFFFSNILIPMLVSVIYFGLFVLFLAALSLQTSVNFAFVSRSWNYLLLLAIGGVVIFLAIIIVGKGRKLTFKKSGESLSKREFIFLLLPLTPVAQYIINNHEILSPLGSLSVLLLFGLLSSLYVLAIPALLGFLGSRRVLIPLGLAFSFTIASMALLTDRFNWLENGSLVIQWPFFWVAFLIIWILYGLKDKTILPILVAVLFISNSAVQFVSVSQQNNQYSLEASENQFLALIEGRNPTITPNIYLLVYDAYVTNETMLAYGIDNLPQENFLRELGFELYPQTYSIFRKTTATMSRVLNPTSVLVPEERRRVTAGDGIIPNTLKQFGYETYGLFPSDYFFRGFDSTYDFSIPERSSEPLLLLQAILMGEFKFDVGFDVQPRDYFLETKQSVFSDIPKSPAFIYMHTDLPAHSQNSGVCQENEVELYQSRLASANSEMQQDLITIIENDPGAIVILAGDHGPHLTKNCIGLEDGGYDLSEVSRLDIQDRFGTFLAIRWPSEDYKKYDDIQILQDLFPAVYAYLFEDVRFLDAKIEASTRGSIYSVEDGNIHGGINDGEPLFTLGE
jgi:hypothetical protein